MPVATDEEAALVAITSLNELSKGQQEAHAQILSILHEDESTSFVDIHELFRLYDVLYFRSLLSSRVAVTWSSRLTLCAGICELVKDDTGKYGRIRLKMSEPLLKYRPRSDTINTLLHEAIHAYFFVASDWRHSRGDDGTGHGPGFLLLADAISNHGSYLITVYHAFHDEVDSYRKHVWKCDGPCQLQPPYFGIVRRSMNRPPSTSDSWWSKHEHECRGTYIKISEPEMTKAQVNALSAKERAGRQKNKIDGYVRTKAAGGEGSTSQQATEFLVQPNTSTKRRLQPEDKQADLTVKRFMVVCPTCGLRLEKSTINHHLDTIHNF